NAPAIKKKLDKSNTKPGDIQTVKDLERLPITHKHELGELQQSEPPFGGFLGVPMDRLKRICMSPGPIYEPEEIHSQNDRWTQAFFAAGFRKGDIGQITFSYHLVPPEISGKLLSATTWCRRPSGLKMHCTGWDVLQRQAA
ncbi:MAG: hypothetical protein JRI70_08890, partial [Deltaproteobacteria bacterium]|nr:hypothetical protein [Deltaproteobacteria bacterium]